ncbi:hypothetical protein Tco_1570427, partial [Tanacetum coccineum]
VFYDNECGEDYGMWPTCNPDLSFCSGYDAIYGKGEIGMLEKWMCFRDHERQSVGRNHMIFADFLKVRYGNKSIDDTTRERRYYEWVAQNSEFNDIGISHEATMYDNPCKYHHEYPTLILSPENTSRNSTPKKNADQIHQEDPISNIKTYFPDFPQPRLRKPRPRDYLYEEMLRIKLGHTNISKFVQNEVLNEWVIDSFDIEFDYGKTCDNPYSRRFDEYREVFDNEIKQLENEYNLRIGKKGYALDDVQEKCEKYHGGTVYPWHDEGFEEEEKWESGIEKTDYEPPFVDIETFEIKRANGSRFMGMIRKEMNEEGGSHSKEMEFEVTSTRIHVVKMFLLGRNYFSYAVTDIAMA